MPSPTRRIRSLVLAFALVLALIPLAPLTPAGVANAQSDELTQRQFDDLIDDVQADDPIFGPEDGELAHDVEVVTLASAGVEAADVLISATFHNPYAGSANQFDMGIQFRAFQDGDEVSYLRFIAFSTGLWALTDTGNEEIAGRGEYEEYDLSRRGENELTVYAEGKSVHLAINGEYVGSAEVSYDDAGDVSVGTAFVTDSFQEDEVTEFSDFTVWEIGGSSRTSSEDQDDPTPEDKDDDNSGRSQLPKGDKDPTPVDEDPTPVEDDDDPTPVDDDKPKSDADYESPTYGYTLVHDNSWEISSESSDNGLDFLSLGNGVSTVQIITSSESRANVAECRDVYQIYAVGLLENAGLVGEVSAIDEGTISSGNRDGSAWILVLLVAEGGSETSIYVECGPLDGSDYQVGIVHFAPASEYIDEEIAREDLVSGLSATSQGSDPDPVDPDKNDRDADDLSTHVVLGDDGIRTYTSPTYGFTVGILPEFTIEEDSVANGYDTLVVANDVSRVTVSGFVSSNTAVGCIDSILANLNNDPSLSAFEIAQTVDGETSRVDSEGQSEIAVYFTASSNGTQVDLGRYYACFSVSNGDAMLVFAYETAADVFPDEFENVNDMLDLIRVP